MLQRACTKNFSNIFDKCLINPRNFGVNVISDFVNFKNFRHFNEDITN